MSNFLCSFPYVFLYILYIVGDHLNIRTLLSIRNYISGILIFLYFSFSMKLYFIIVLRNFKNNFNFMVQVERLVTYILLSFLQFLIIIFYFRDLEYIILLILFYELVLFCKFVNIFNVFIYIQLLQIFLLFYIFLVLILFLHIIVLII